MISIKKILTILIYVYLPIVKGQTINSIELPDMKGIIDKINQISPDKQDITKVLIDGKFISFRSYLGGTINYTTEDTLNGVKEDINGSSKYGYHRQTTYRQTSIMDIVDYFPDCRPKYVRKQWYALSAAGRVIFPVGKGVIYKESGRIEKVINYERLLRFTYADVLEYLNKQYPGFIIGDVIAQLNSKGGYFWQINGYSPKKGRTELKIDCLAGKVTWRANNILSIE